MEWGDVTPLRTKAIRLLEGDLFVTVVNAHGLQTDNATSYCMEELRPTGIALATMQARMEAHLPIPQLVRRAGHRFPAEARDRRVLPPARTRRPARSPA